MALLQKIKKQQAAVRLATGSAWEYEINDLVFTDLIGNTIPYASVEHEFKKIVTAAGCPEHRFHDLRHTFATLALQHHADVKTLSKALGHRSVAFTLDVYGHVSEEMSDGFADLVEDIISSR
jgi:integrase